MLYRAHLGKEKDLASLSRWLELLTRSRKRIWDGGKKLVKDFRACQGLFDIVLDGHIVGAIATACGCKSVHDLASELPNVDVGGTIERLCNYLVKFDTVAGNRRQTSEQRDMPHENLVLFLQHGLTLRNYVHAMKTGDPGRVFASLSYITLWFQATKQHNYATECIHLTACVRKLWSPELTQSYMQMCLLNPSGKLGGWMACDYINEYVVRENQSFAPSNMTAKSDDYLRNTIAVQIWDLRAARKKMALECDTNPFGNHSSTVDAAAEVELIVSKLLGDNLCRYIPGRGGEESQTNDLFVAGQEKLGTTQRLTAWKKDLAKKGFISDVNIDGDEGDEGAERDMEDDLETEDSDDDIGNFLSDSDND
jgi:hypothetical protein